MAGRVHEQLVAQILHDVPGAKLHKFGAAVAKMVGGVDVLKREEWWPLHVTPDAFVIDGPTAIAYEVEIASPCTHDKLWLYNGLWGVLDDLGFTLRLVRIDAMGSVSEMDMLALERAFQENHAAFMRRNLPEYFGPRKLQ